MGKTRCCEKVVGLRKGRWSREEDEVLSRYIQAYGHGSWMSLPFKAGLLRCGKSCRLRWINYLRGGLKRGNFTREEDEVIVKLHTSLGNRWSTIARHLPGRTDNEIKNYWNCHLSHKNYSYMKTKNDTTQPFVNTYNVVNQTKRKHDRVKMAKSNDQAFGKNSTWVNMIIKENRKVDEHMDMSFVLGGDVMDSNGIMKVYDKNQTNYSLTKVDFDHFNMHASIVDYKEYESLTTNSLQTMGCFDENLVNYWEIGFGFEGFNVCDNDDYNDGMFLWPWN